MSAEIRFLLNDQEVTTSVHPGTLVLDYLRQREKLVGTKEGCREGDCGACTVLVGELENEKVSYKPVTCCLMPLGELYGKHLVTIEGLNMPQLTPVQQAIVEEGATQCGFCTPGIVVSLTGLLMGNDVKINNDNIKKALSGHLCRCTGYRSLKESKTGLREIIGNQTGVDALADREILPKYFRGIPSRLRKIPKSGVKSNDKTPDFFIAGGTDIYVQKGEIIPESHVNVLNLHPEMKQISRKNGHIHIGALTTFEEFSEHHDILKIIPDIQDYMFLIASWQIRNRATLGGNIVNASPIGDMTILFLALDSGLILQEGDNRRTVPIIDFYQGYKQLDKTPSEILTEILIPEISPNTQINWEKVSKRKCLDIASVNSAIKIRCEDNVIREIGLAVGGVAPIPLYLKETCGFLTGESVSKETIRGAFSIAQNEISPISDIRGSADYKRLLVHQLFVAHFTKLFPKEINIRDFL